MKGAEGAVQCSLCRAVAGGAGVWRDEKPLPVRASSGDPCRARASMCEAGGWDRWDRWDGWAGWAAGRITRALVPTALCRLLRWQ